MLTKEAGFAKAADTIVDWICGVRSLNYKKKRKENFRSTYIFRIIITLVKKNDYFF